MNTIFYTEPLAKLHEAKFHINYESVGGNFVYFMVAVNDIHPTKVIISSCMKFGMVEYSASIHLDDIHEVSV